MNRRDFIGTIAAGLAVTRIPDLLASPKPSPSKSSPAWLGQTPLVLAGNHDSIPLFRRRVGGSTTWQEEEFENSHSEEAARKIKEAGVTLWITHFYKGFGLEAEKEYIAMTRDFVPLLKKHGIKVGLYVGSTVAYETFLLEKPEAEEWFVPDFIGMPVFYDAQTFRKRVYFMHPGYREYMRRVVRLAIEEVKADLIHFDNTSMQAEPAIFQHPLAIEHFREYLRNKYSEEDLKKRFGFSNVKYVLPPRYDRPLTRIIDPLFQEWTDFRCHQLNRYYAEMEELIRRLNPNVVVESNPHSEISGRNTIWEQGVYYPELLSHMDAVWTEEGNPAGVSEDGIMVNRIRSFKNASTLDITLFVGTGGPHGSTLQMAESMAFGRQCLGDIGGVLGRGEEIPEDQRNYISFFHKNFDDYRDVQNIADTALLYSYASMGFNNDRPAVSFMLIGQALIQAKVLFDIIFNENLKDLSRYRVLVLADQECLDDDKLDLIRKFVRQGGGLVATEHTSLYTEWRLRRPDFGLKDLFNVAAPHWRGTRSPEEVLKAGPVRNQFGRGRVAYIAEVKPAIEKPPTVRMTSQFWKLPVNWEELIQAVRWAAGGNLSLEVNAPLTVAAELTMQNRMNTLLLHLLNYNAARTPSATEVGVTLRIPERKKVRNVSLLSPDEEGIHSPPTKIEDGEVRFVVPRLKIYTLAVIQME